MVVIKWLLVAALIWALFIGVGAVLVPFTSDEDVALQTPIAGFAVIAAASWGIARLTSAGWLVTALLVWGLFTGIAYALVPLLVDRGSALTTGIGVLLVVACGWALLRVEPRLSRRAAQPD
jgi:hypothetical protein